MKFQLKKYLMVLGVMIVVAFLVINIFRMDEHISGYLSNKMQEFSQDRYNISIDSLNYSILPPSISVFGVKIKSNDSAYIKTNENQWLLADVSIKEVQLMGINLIYLLLKNELYIDDAYFQDPDLTLIVTTKPRNEVFFNNDNIQSTSLLLFNHLAVTNGKLTFKRDSLEFTTHYQFDGTFIEFSNDRQPWKANQYLLDLENVSGTTADNFYHLSCDRISIVYPENHISIRMAKIQPIPGKLEMGRIKNHEVDWISSEIETIEFKSFDLLKLKQDTFRMASLNVEASNTLVFRDKRLVFPDIPDKPMPHEYLKKLGLYFWVDSINIINSKIIYQEHVAGSSEPGEVHFNNLNLHGAMVVDKGGSGLKFACKTRVMQGGLLEAELFFPISDSLRNYHATGTLFKMNLKEFNPMLTYVAGVTIKEGHSERLDFNFDYNKFQSSGEMRFKYENLSIQFKDVNQPQIKHGIDEALMNFISNTFVIKKDNLPGKKMRLGKIMFNRNPKKSIFNYWWKSVLSGIKSSTGIKEEK